MVSISLYGAFICFILLRYVIYFVMALLFIILNVFMNNYCILASMSTFKLTSYFRGNEEATKLFPR
jgi:hypothetical protein